jgi:hypothetical protein
MEKYFLYDCEFEWGSIFKIIAILKEDVWGSICKTFDNLKGMYEILKYFAFRYPNYLILRPLK